jgi:hypothetical protein
MRRPSLLPLASLLAILGCSARGTTSGPVEPVDTGVANDIAVDTPAPEDRGMTPEDVPTPPPDTGVMDAGVRDIPVTIDLGPPPDVCVPSGTEAAATCFDQRDNDCDGLRDCADPGCASVCGPPDTGPVDTGPVDLGPPVDGCTPTGTENTNTACADGRDNDCDGFTDCGGSGRSPDFDCSRNPAVTVCCTPTGPENTNAACTDGVDNDCDGYIDCNGPGSPDFDCTFASAVTVCPRDGGVVPDTSGCVFSAIENTNTTCGDGRDNDCDGFIDCNDLSCTRTCAVSPAVCASTLRDAGVACVCGGPEDTTTTCSDGRDNDCDGFTDCSDFECQRAMNPRVTICP